MSKRVFMIVVAGACVAILLQVASHVEVSRLHGAETIENLTGRTFIWDTSLRVWLENPVFGYGLNLWIDEAFRAKYGAFAHAHNQYIHALASAGVVGLFGLIVYLGSAWFTAARARKMNPIPIAMLALILTQSMTDVPLRQYFLLDSFFVLHMIVFAFLIQATKLTTRRRVERPFGQVAAPSRAPCVAP